MDYQSYPQVDTDTVEKVINKLKTQGIFDQFRKDCLADVDTKPAYQNLQQRVNTAVANFLSNHTWKPDLNKNQLRESLRRHLQQGFLDVGVERIVDQVVNPKMGSVFMPKIEDIICETMGIEKPKIPVAMRIDLVSRPPPAIKLPTKDLLPKDLEQVSSPESESGKKVKKESIVKVENREESLSGISDLSSHGSESQLVTQKSIDNGVSNSSRATPVNPGDCSSTSDFDNFSNLKEKLRITDTLGLSQDQDSSRDSAEVDSNDSDAGSDMDIDHPLKTMSPIGVPRTPEPVDSESGVPPVKPVLDFIDRGSPPKHSFTIASSTTEIVRNSDDSNSVMDRKFFPSSPSAESSSVSQVQFITSSVGHSPLKVQNSEADDNTSCDIVHDQESSKLALPEGRPEPVSSTIDEEVRLLAEDKPDSVLPDEPMTQNSEETRGSDSLVVKTEEMQLTDETPVSVQAVEDSKDVTESSDVDIKSEISPTDSSDKPNEDTELPQTPRFDSSDVKVEDNQAVSSSESTSLSNLQIENAESAENSNIEVKQSSGDKPKEDRSKSSSHRDKERRSSSSRHHDRHRSDHSKDRKSSSSSDKYRDKEKSRVSESDKDKSRKADDGKSSRDKDRERSSKHKSDRHDRHKSKSDEHRHSSSSSKDKSSSSRSKESSSSSRKHDDKDKSSSSKDKSYSSDKSKSDSSKKSHHKDDRRKHEGDDKHRSHSSSGSSKSQDKSSNSDKKSGSSERSKDKDRKDRRCDEDRKKEHKRRSSDRDSNGKGESKRKDSSSHSQSRDHSSSSRRHSSSSNKKGSETPIDTTSAGSEDVIDLDLMIQQIHSSIEEEERKSALNSEPSAFDNLMKPKFRRIRNRASLIEDLESEESQESLKFQASSSGPVKSQLDPISETPITKELKVEVEKLVIPREPSPEPASEESVNNPEESAPEAFDSKCVEDSVADDPAVSDDNTISDEPANSVTETVTDNPVVTIAETTTDEPPISVRRTRSMVTRMSLEELSNSPEVGCNAEALIEEKSLPVSDKDASDPEVIEASSDAPVPSEEQKEEEPTEKLESPKEETTEVDHEVPESENVLQDPTDEEPPASAEEPVVKSTTNEPVVKRTRSMVTRRSLEEPTGSQDEEQASGIVLKRRSTSKYRRVNGNDDRSQDSLEPQEKKRKTTEPTNDNENDPKNISAPSTPSPAENPPSAEPPKEVKTTETPTQPQPRKSFRRKTRSSSDGTSVDPIPEVPPEPEAPPPKLRRSTVQPEVKAKPQKKNGKVQNDSEPQPTSVEGDKDNKDKSKPAPAKKNPETPASVTKKAKTKDSQNNNETPEQNKNQRSARTINQRYNSSDLYKPRPMVTRRPRGDTSNTDSEFISSKRLRSPLTEADSVTTRRRN